MLTRLKVTGFKNLVDVDVRFGPFTCIAGVNAAGKSNLFDAIRFLSLLAEKPLVEAARAVRGSGNRSLDIRSLFTRIGDGYVDEMSFEAEMIVPSEGVDDLGQPVRASATFLRYSLKLIFQPWVNHHLVSNGVVLRPEPQLQIADEQLVSLSAEEARAHVGFACATDWFQSLVYGDRSEQIIRLQDKTKPQHEKKLILLYDEPSRRELFHTAEALPTTVLSRVEFDQNQAAVMAQQEMRSRRVFSLFPAKIGEPGSLIDPPEIGEDGAHVAAALYRLAHEPPTDGQDAYEAETAVYARVSNRLAKLVDDVRDVTVDLDEAREALTIQATGRDGTKHSARALSDGTLRFLALAVLEQQESPGVYCIEEPENGIHPARIPALLKLLQAIAMDTQYPVEPGNPLRQVIISTHSPSIVSRVPGDSLVVAELRNSMRDGKRFKRAHFSGLSGTWRVGEGQRAVALGELLKYLNPEGYRPLPEPRDQEKPDAERRILDRADVRDLLSPTPIDG